MLFEDSARKYPHLVQALNVLSQRRFAAPAPPNRAGVTLAAGALAALAGLAAHLGAVEIVVLSPAVMALTGAIYRPRPPLPPSAEEIRAREATRVAQGMGLMLAKRRLHRDLDQGSLILLEECARYWARAKAALEGPFWTAGLVPEHYALVRAQALRALDEAMDDVLIEYRAYIPENVANRHAMDYVDEALESFVKGPKGRGGAHLAAPFANVRQIAEKMRELTLEAERLTQEARIDPDLMTQPSAGSSLDQTLSELRQIREAEEELRERL